MQHGTFKALRNSSTIDKDFQNSSYALALPLYHAHFFIINITILKKQTEKWVELGMVVNLCEEI